MIPGIYYDTMRAHMHFVLSGGTSEGFSFTSIKSEFMKDYENQSVNTEFIPKIGFAL